MNKPTLRFISTMKYLDNLFLDAIQESDNNKRKALLSFITIKLHDQWNFRCRQIILLSYGHTQGKMLYFLRCKWSPKKRMDKNWEPDWHIPNTALRAARILTLPNYITLQNVFGAITCIDDIRWTRNAIVHNVPCSYQQYKEMALSKYRIINVDPAYLLQELNPVTGNTIYQDWCTEMINVLNIAI